MQRRKERKELRNLLTPQFFAPLRLILAFHIKNVHVDDEEEVWLSKCPQKSLWKLLKII